ncbi:hypothetical protein GN244_ATG07186 [Phytophthora infestans]|uniref:Uncharacterized protein n=1 Tax=Phytophthora infestans TaxID=4787 RepID=A0A833S4T7_PHYIN|nr:hypothetical protein GN244_ATG07186 [Phytophthora infestans]
MVIFQLASPSHPLSALQYDPPQPEQRCIARHPRVQSGATATTLQGAAVMGSRNRRRDQRRILRMAILTRRWLYRHAHRDGHDGGAVRDAVVLVSATIPAGGGPYIIVLHSIGPRAAFFSGLAETLKVIAVNSSTFYTIYSYLQTLFNVDQTFAPAFFIAFGILFGGLNSHHVFLGHPASELQPMGRRAELGENGSDKSN